MQWISYVSGRVLIQWFLALILMQLQLLRNSIFDELRVTHAQYSRVK